MEIRIDITEVVQLSKNIAGAPAIIQDEMTEVLRLAGYAVEGRAKELAPVDTNRLRNSITPDVKYPVLTVGSDVEYAPYQELGTQNPDGTQRIKPKRFLQGGYEQNASRIQGFADRGIAKIIARLKLR